MNVIGNLLSSILLLFLLMIPGILLGKTGKMDRRVIPVISDLLTYVAMPALVIEKLLDTDVKAIAKAEFAACVLIPVLVEIAVLAVACLAFPRTENDRCTRVARFCAVFPNCGFLGIPLAEAMYPDKPEITMYISLFNVISTVMLLSVGEYLLSGQKKDIRPGAIVKSPVFWAMIAGGVGSMTGVCASFPRVSLYFHYLSGLTVPLSMIVLGYHLSELRAFSVFRSWRTYMVCFLKLILSPVLALGLLCIWNLFCPSDISEELICAMFIATSVCTAASAPALAEKHGLDGDYAGGLTLATTLMCLLTLPAVIFLFCRVLPG